MPYALFEQGEKLSRAFPTEDDVWRHAEEAGLVDVADGKKSSRTISSSSLAWRTKRSCRRILPGSGRRKFHDVGHYFEWRCRVRKPKQRPMDIQPVQAFGVCQSTPVAVPDDNEPAVLQKVTTRKTNVDPAAADLSRQKAMKTQRAALAKKASVKGKPS